MNPLKKTLDLYRNAYAGLAPATWWLSLILLINRSGTMVIPFLTVYMTQHLHFTITQAGIVMACFGTGAIVGATAGGWLADRIGFYQVQFWSLFSNGLLFILLGQMHTFPQLCICVFALSSVGDAFRPANSMAIAAYSKPENRTRSYALNRLAVNLGWSVGPAIGGLLASFSYDLLFWVDGATCMFAAIMMRILLPPVPAPAKSHADHTVPKESIWKDHIYITFLVFAMINAICLFQFSSIVPLYFKEVLRMQEWAIGLTMSINGIMIAVIEMVMIYRLEGRFPDLLFIVRGSILVAVAYYVIAGLPAWWVVAPVFMVIITFGEMLCLPFMNSFWIARSQTHNRGQYAALYTISYSVANIVSPTAGAFVVGHLGFTYWWIITGSVCLIAATGFYLLQQRIDFPKKYRI
ncbi:Predicted arabinose efflux permease, MFS family [Chitinophaga jiangningensis]|uniref:Predicted arabinose efflux permease, MFS family n=1 Tax=Chitinophaga jiangningensis TaxID=1419482 RepID=A0A1M7KYV2_9BACT|nr:MFS transporter [Chitinophaga jiangningensis]SHM70750.1 Predicted arabinose efflux permease, MFS family [Chitinophaga jiangningensis]